MTSADFAYARWALNRRLTRLLWLWALGEVWFTLLMAGVVVVLLWAR